MRRELLPVDPRVCTERVSPSYVFERFSDKDIVPMNERKPAVLIFDVNRVGIRLFDDLIKLLEDAVDVSQESSRGCRVMLFMKSQLRLEVTLFVSPHQRLLLIKIC